MTRAASDAVIGRRELLAAGAVGAGLLLAPSAEACSLVAERREPFSDAACRSALGGFVQLLNEGPQLTDEQIVERVDPLGVSIDPEMVRLVLGDRNDADVRREYTFYKEFRLSGEIADPRPIALDDINRIRRLRNRATYQFTLRRYSYHPADWEGCNGLFTHDEYYGYDRTAYLATFLNNQLRSVRLFPEWYLEEPADG